MSPPPSPPADPTARTAPFSAPVRALMTFGPTILFIPVVLAVYAFEGARAAWFLGAMALGCFIGGGKLVIFAGAADSAPLGVWPLAVLVVYGDVAVALFMLANLHHLDRVRWVGQRLAGAHEAASQVLRVNPWMRKLMWSGVAIFVAIPFQGTGAMMGAILGRVLGLTAGPIFSSITVGATVSAILLALLGRIWRQRITWLVENPAIGFAVVVVCLGLTAWLGKWFMTRGGGSGRPPAAT